MPTAISFTPTQRCMLEVLRDGLPHKPSELRLCLPDDLGAEKNIRIHISNIRAKLKAKGEYIVCEIFRRKVHYRRVKLIAGATKT